MTPQPTVDEEAPLDPGQTDIVGRTTADVPSRDPDDRSPEHLGRYAVTGRLGQGGMGEVWQIRDDQLGRDLAAKVLRTGGPSELRMRFVREAQISGQLEHPNIVPVHELGVSAGGRVYFTMKQVRGDDLGTLLDHLRETGHGPSLLERLHAFLKICDAVAFAHSRGVIHRDLKPANVMMGEFGEVVVMDWGLAKGLEDEPSEVVADAPSGAGGRDRDAGLRTQHGQVMGTPAYMAPEQAEGRIDKLDRRSDVYALGAVLYHLLALHPPFGGSDVAEVLASVRAGNLIPPSRRAPAAAVPWELEAAVMKAMAIRPANRYQDVGTLRSEIVRWIEGQTLAAARYGLLQRLAKWVQRHRIFVNAAGAVLLAAVAIGAVAVRNIAVAREREADERRRAEGEAERATLEAGRARDAEAQAREALAATNVALAQALVERADRLLRGNHVLAAQALVAGARRLADQPAVRACELDIPMARVWPDRELTKLRGLTCLGAGGGRFVAGLREGRTCVYDTERDDIVWEREDGDALKLAVSADASRLATASLCTIRVWRVSDGEDVRLEAEDADQWCDVLALSADGNRLAAAWSNGRVVAWSLGEHPPRQLWRTEAGSRVGGLAWSPDGKSVACASGAVLRLHDGESGVAEPVGTSSYGTISALAMSRDGSWLATGHATGSQQSWQLDVSPRKRRNSQQEAQGAPCVRAMDWASNARGLALAYADGTVAIYETPFTADSTLRKFRAHVGDATGVAFLGTDRVVSTGSDGAVRQWRVSAGHGVRERDSRPAHVVALARLPDGRIACASSDGAVDVLDPRTGELEVFLPALRDERAAILFPPWIHLAAARRGRFARFHSHQRLYRITDWPRPETTLELRLADLPSTAAIDPSGRWLAAVTKQGLEIHDLDRPAEPAVRREPGSGIPALAFSHDSAVLAVASGIDGIELIALPDGHQLVVLGTRPTSANLLAFSPDGRRLASASGNDLSIWETNGGRRLSQLPDVARCTALAFSADGSLLASGGVDGAIRIWDVERGSVLRTLAAHQTAVLALLWGERSLASSSATPTVRLWGLDAPAPDAAQRATGLELDGIRVVPLSGERFGAGTAQAAAWPFGVRDRIHRVRGWLAAKEVEHALVELARVREDDPSCWEAWFYAGRALVGSDRGAEALPLLRQARSLMPADVDPVVAAEVVVLIARLERGR